VLWNLPLGSLISLFRTYRFVCLHIQGGWQVESGSDLPGLQETNNSLPISARKLATITRVFPLAMKRTQIESDFFEILQDLGAAAEL